jgi:hypothetical protein
MALFSCSFVTQRRLTGEEVEGRPPPPFEVRLFASLLFVEVYKTSPILLVGILINPSDPSAFFDF